MHKNHHTQSVGQPPHAHSRPQPRVRDRMRACLSQDRLEELRIQTPEGGSDVVMRNLVLDLFGDDRDIIRNSLNVCERISKKLSTL